MDSDVSESALFTASLVRATPVSVTFMSLMAESLSFVDSTLVLELYLFTSQEFRGRCVGRL